MYIPQPRIFRYEKFTADFFETTSATATAQPTSSYLNEYYKSTRPLDHYYSNSNYTSVSDNIGMTVGGSEYLIPVGKFKVTLEVLERHPTSQTARFSDLQGLYFYNAASYNGSINKTLTEVRDTGETDGTGNTIISIKAQCLLEVTSGTLQLWTSSGSYQPTWIYGNVYKYVTTIEKLDANKTYFNTAQSN